MTDPTRAEVGVILNGDGEVTIPRATLRKLAAENQALRERAEAAEAESKAADFRLVDRYRNPKTGIFNFPDDVAAIVRALDAARRAEAAAWDDAARICDELAIGYARQRSAVWALTEAARDIRALRRAAPTEGEA